MTDYTIPPTDPVLEAAEEILCSVSREFSGDAKVKEFVREYQGTACTIVRRAARWIDYLRAIGAIPERGS